MSSTNINNQKGENCYQKLVWTCDPNSYPRCTAQWVIECDPMCHLPFSENSKDG